MNKQNDKKKHFKKTGTDLKSDSKTPFKVEKGELNLLTDNSAVREAL